MKKMRKVVAMLLALAMVLGMSLTVFGANVKELNGAVPSSSDNVDITIDGLEGTETITLYQIAAADYATGNQNGFEGTYTWAKGMTPEQINAILKMAKGETSDIDQETTINAIVQGIAKSTIAATPVTAGAIEAGKSSTNVGVGVYVAVIEGTGEYIYNPLLLTATYNEDGDLEGGALNVAKAVYGEAGTAKRSSQNVDKEIDVKASSAVVDDEDVDKIDGKPDGDHTASLGSVIAYKVTPTIPTYPANAINKTFYITDRMDKGLTYDHSSLTITANDTPIKANEAGEFVYGEGEDAVVIAKAAEAADGDRAGFNLAFQYDNLKAKGLIATGSIVVTYEARVNENAVVGNEGNINTATLIFSRNPNVGKTWDEPDEKPEPDKANGLDKKEKEEIVYTYQIAFLKKNDDGEVLKDAIFGIYADANCTDLVDVVITNEKGYAVSTQVAKGTYYVKEIQAPTGYSLNTEVYEVTATWKTAVKTAEQTVTTREYTTESGESLNGIQVGWILDGVFYENKPSAELEARVGKKADAAYVKSETTTTTKVTTIEENTDNDTEGAGTVYVGDIVNTKLSALPSTGGIGTTIFTIAGCLIMIVAAGLFFASRRKSAK